MFYMSGLRLLRIVLAFLIFSAIPAFGLTMHEFTSEDVSFEWVNSDTRTEWFEVRLRWLDMSTPPAVMTESTRIEKGVFMATLKRPRVGHWAVEVRACANFKWDCTENKLVWDASGTIPQCSNWQKSDVIGKPEPWAVYWKPPSVFNIDINDYTP